MQASANAFAICARLEPSAYHAGNPLLAVRLALERCLVLHAVVAGEAFDQRVAHPFLQDAAEILPGYPGHRGEIALAHLLMDQDAAGADLLAECVREAQLRARPGPAKGRPDDELQR